MTKRTHPFYRLISFRLIGLIVLISVLALTLTAGQARPAAAENRSLDSGSADGTARRQPDGESIPLRVMVPSDMAWAALQQQGITSITQLFPLLDPAQSFSPGPRMELPFHGRDQAVEPNAAPANPFRTLAILVEFSDNQAQTAETYFDNLVFGPSGSTMRSFYLEASYTQLDVVTVNLPSSLGWRTAPQSYAYYTSDQYCLYAPYPNNCQRLAEDMATLVNNTVPAVDFSQYDNDGDGWVDTVFIIHAGTGAELGGTNNDAIWSHSWQTLNPPSVDGVWVGSYITMPELWTTPGDMTHGVYAHEFGHALGLPDLYDVDNTSQGVGDWSLMSGGSWNGSMGNSPAHFDAWSRAYLEFNPVNDITTFNGVINLPNIEQNRFGSLYRLNSARSGEYWLLENRQKIGSDAALPGAGLLIWHVDENLGGSNRYECRSINNYLCNGTLTKHFRVALEQADGDRDLEYKINQGDTGDPFPGAENNRDFSFTTNPNTSSYYSSNAPAFEVHNISNSASTMSAEIGAPLPVPAAPTLLSPASGSKKNDNTPTLAWNPATYATTYQVQIDDSSGFGTPEKNETTASTSYTPSTTLPDKLYYWRVRGVNADGKAGAWSAVWSLTIDSVLPATPTLATPKSLASIKDTTPTLTWNLATGASKYEVQVSHDQAFPLPLSAGTTKTGTSYTVPSALNFGVYYWRVRALDAAENVSGWSAINVLTITPLLSPKNAQHLTDHTPTFQLADLGTIQYHFQVDELNPVDGDFTTPVFDKWTRTGTPGGDLPEGDYQWRGQINTGSGWSVWSPVWTFTITPPTPTAPGLTSPAGGALLTTTTPYFTWNAPTVGGHAYQIQIDNADTFASPVQDVVLDPDSVPDVFEYTADPLPNGGKYYWRVRAINSVGVAGAWSVKRSFTLTQLAKPTPVSPAIGAVTGDNTPTFEWSTVNNALNYQIQIDNNQNFSSPERDITQDGNLYTPDPLADAKYYWRVRAISTDGIGGIWSGVWNVTVDTTGPIAPALVTPVNRAGTADTTPYFEWGSSAGAVEYNFRVASDAACTTTVLPDKLRASLTYTLGTALNYGVYYWCVQARDAQHNWGEWSTPFQLAITILTSPKDGSSTTNRRPSFQWAALPGATLYHIQIDDDPNFGSLWGEAENTPSRSVTPNIDLPLGVSYWRVRATNGPNTTWMPTWSVIITPAKPGATTLVSPANAALTNDATPVFTWLTTTNGHTYQIQIDNNGDFRSPVQDVIVGTGLLSYTALDLTDGLYNWRVRAINTEGAPGAWSAKRTFTVDTLAPPVPTMVTPLDGATSTNTMLKLDWDVSTGANTYQLQLDQDSGFPLPPIYVGTATEYKPPTPLSRGTYYWRVQAIDKAGNASGFSAYRRFDIIAGITAPPITGEPPAATEGVPPTPESTEPGVTPDPTVTPTPEPTEPGITTATPEPPVEPPTPTPTDIVPTVMLPVMDSCEMANNWQVNGVWNLVAEQGYRGGAWLADSTIRDQSSALVLLTLIDLRVAQQPELRYWQRLDLSSRDLIAVDLSVDSGQTWLPTNQQAGQMADWHEQALDLSPYRGFAVMLRFRLETSGQVLEGERTNGWWVDELVIQEAMPVPTPTVVPPTETPVPTDTPVPPTATPLPTEPPTPEPTVTPVPTELPAPTPEPTVEPPTDVPPDSNGTGG
jgi:immune inhibitor A